MFTGRVSCCQGCPSEANHTADSHNTPSASLCHVRQHLLSYRDCTEEIEVHQGLVHINTSLQAKRALASAAIVYEDINLKRHGGKEQQDLKESSSL